MILFEHGINGKFFKLILGSIIEEDVDAIVNPANEQLFHGGGVAGLILKAGGEKIQKESDEKAPIPTGSSTFTGAGKLPYKFIIHTVGPIFRGGNNNEPELLKTAVYSALDTAGTLRLNSVSMPSISTGIFGYPLAPAIRIITSSIFSFMKRNSSLNEIRLCEFDPEKASQIKEIIEEVKYQ